MFYWQLGVWGNCMSIGKPILQAAGASRVKMKKSVYNVQNYNDIVKLTVKLFWL